jgi:predicted RND superfamily exporter protein
VIFVLAAAMGLVSLALVSRVTFDANVLRLLPQQSPAVRAFDVFLRDFGSLDHLYVVFESPDAIGEHADLVNAYAAALRQAPEIESVDAQLFEPGKDWSYLSNRELHLLGAAGASEALARFRQPRIDGEMMHARQMLSVPSPEVKALVQQDPLGLLTMLRDRLGREKGAIAFDPTQEGYVSADGRNRLLIVKPKGQPFDTDFCKALFRRLGDVERGARRNAGADGSSDLAVTIQPAGAYRVSFEAEQLIRREGIINGVGSMVLLLLLVFALFRTPWVMLYGFVPLTLAGLATLGVNGLLQGSLSPATSGSAGMLFGLGIDGIVVLYVRFMEERRAGWSAEEATRRMSGTASSVVLAQLTTAATFLALLLIDFPTLQSLGALIGFGILVCCALTLLLLPALLARRTDTPMGRSLTSAWLGNWVTRHAAAILWTSAAATVLLGAASVRVRLDTGIERLQAETRGASLERQIADRFSLPRDVLLVLNAGTELDPLLETDARLTQTLADRLPSVVASGASVLLPSSRTQAEVAGLIERSELAGNGARLEVEAAAKRAGFRPEAFSPFLSRLPSLVDPSERITYQGLVDHGLESVVSRFVVRKGGRYEAVTYLYAQQAVDLGALTRLVHDVDANLRLTGLPAINDELGRRFLPQFLKAIGIGAVAVAAVIYMVFRSVRHSLLALLPTAVGFVWSAGVLALARVELDLLSMFAAVSFIGITVDYSIYVLYRYLVERSGDMRAVLTRTAPGIMIACATTVIGFGTLINSSYAPLRTLGIASVVALVCCVTASLVFLPALVLRLERWPTSAR